MTGNLLDLGTLVLYAGGHAGPDGDMCLLEAAAYMAGEPWSDRPQCVCPVLGSFGRTLNDVLPDAKRQRLVPLLPELLNTAGDGHAQERSYMALDWLIRTYLPTWLSVTPRIHPERAKEIQALAPIVDIQSARAAGDLVRRAGDEAAAAGAAARAAAGDAAGDAAGAAAGAALKATVDRLQESAITLYISMVLIGKQS